MRAALYFTLSGPFSVMNNSIVAQSPCVCIRGNLQDFHIPFTLSSGNQTRIQEFKAVHAEWEGHGSLL